LCLRRGHRLLLLLLLLLKRLRDGHGSTLECVVYGGDFDAVPNRATSDTVVHSCRGGDLETLVHGCAASPS